MFTLQKYCSSCGKEVVLKYAEGRDRIVCEHCNTIHYTNPKLVVGTLAVWEDKILLCCCAIEGDEVFGPSRYHRF